MWAENPERVNICVCPEKHVTSLEGNMYYLYKQLPV
jgi:hypothetical protein